jgi:PTH1 family peptidyl-tRNA hydrolase
VSADSLAPWIVLGLGNPGPKYVDTRHNVGAMVVSRLAEAHSARLKPQRRVRCDVADTRIDGHRVLLAIAHSYMNESGGPTSALAQFYKVPAENLVVVQDEIDLPFGALRVKYGGGDNGHNGLRSIRRSLGTGDWYRIRMGVGRPSGSRDAAGHVLARFSGSERKQLPGILDTGASTLVSLIEKGLSATQGEFNS